MENNQVLEKTAKVEAPIDSGKKVTLAIAPPNFQSAKVKLIGKTPLVMNRMSSMSRQNMIAKQESGSRANKGAKRDPKDFDRVFKGAMHIASEGWHGFPASALRAGMISACRLVGFKMTIAKLSVFVDPADGIDAEDGQPLIRIIGNEPVRRDLPVKLADGSTDILPRPFYLDWSAEPTITWDADQFSAADVVNLLSRVGLQCGIGAGRPDSKNSTGMGWGTFRVES
jgi:hypothetical protein